jgi:hypothetical protein
MKINLDWISFARSLASSFALNFLDLPAARAIILVKVLYSNFLMFLRGTETRLCLLMKVFMILKAFRIEE